MTANLPEQAKEKYTPPTFLRHITPWWLLGWIDRRWDTCWAGMVMWKQGYDWDWWPTNTCFDATDGPWDYCNKFDADRKRKVALAQAAAPAPGEYADERSTTLCTCGHTSPAHAKEPPRLCGGRQCGKSYRCECNGFLGVLLSVPAKEKQP